MKTIMKKLFTALSFFLITSLYIPSAFGRINPSLLLRASKYFHNTPGFITVLRKIKSSSHNCHSTQGYEYEIEKAVHITKSNNNEKVSKFDHKIKCPHSKKSREFDLRTNKRLIECKNIEWKKASGKRLKKQFLDQRDLATHYNKTNGTNIMYVVCSKNPIPKRWKAWFHDNKIAFEETASDDLEAQN